MFLLPERSEKPCPYTDLLGIKPRNGVATWFDLLRVSSTPSNIETSAAWQSVRAVVVNHRSQDRSPEWDAVLDNVDKAFMLLDTEPKREQYRQLLQDNGLLATPALPPDNSQAVLPNTDRVRRYTDVRRLGNCGGVVEYEAFDSMTHRKVSTRQLELSSRRDAGKAERFNREVQFLTSLAHPNLIEVYSVSKSSCCFVSEYLPYSPVEFMRTNRAGQYQPDDVRKFLTEALQIVGRIHELGFIHGGLTINDFRMSESGVAKLVHAPRLTNDAFRLPAAKQMCVAPELLAPDAFGAPSAATDFYTLGFIAYGLLAGEAMLAAVPALQDSNAQGGTSTLLWHASEAEQLPPLSELVPGLPLELCKMIGLMCSKAPAQRPQSAVEIIDGIRSTGKPAAALPPTPPPILRMQDDLAARRHQNLIESRDRFQQLLSDPLAAWSDAPKLVRYSLTGCLTAVVALFLMIGNPASEVAMFDEAAVASDWTDVPPAQSTPSRTFAATPVADEEFESMETIVPTQDDEISTSAIAIAEPTEDAMQFESAADESAASVESDSMETRLATSKPMEAANRPDVPHHSIQPFTCERSMSIGDSVEFSNVVADLSFAETHQRQRELLQIAVKLAPHDPRPHLAFWAARGFSESAEESLAMAMELTRRQNLPYLQPWRLQIEAILRSSFSRSLSDDEGDRQFLELDKVFAHLNFYTARLAELSPSMDSQYFWVGQVFGYLELACDCSPGGSEIVRSEKQKFESSLSESQKRMVENGVRWSVLGEFESRNASEFFPPKPRREILICRDSIPSSSPMVTPPSMVASTRMKP